MIHCKINTQVNKLQDHGRNNKDIVYWICHTYRDKCFEQYHKLIFYNDKISQVQL